MKKKFLLFVCSFVISASAAEPQRVLPVSIFSVANGKVQEDAAVAVWGKGHDHSQLSFFGMYDGHNGSGPVNLLQQDLHNQFFAHLEHESSIQAAFEAAIWHVDGFAQREYNTGGSTAVVACIEHNKLHVAFVGDSGLILESEGNVCYFTKPHNVTREDECARLIKAHAIIFRQVIVNESGDIQQQGPWRVNGLVPTRTIGDRRTKNKMYGDLTFDTSVISPDRIRKNQLLDGKIVEKLTITPGEAQIIADPEYIALTLTEKNRWLLLATDGFTDFVLHDKAIALVMKYAKNGEPRDRIAKLLVEKAIKKGSKDNITVMLCDLWELRK